MNETADPDVRRRNTDFIGVFILVYRMDVWHWEHDTASTWTNTGFKVARIRMRMTTTTRRGSVGSYAEFLVLRWRLQEQRWETSKWRGSDISGFRPMCWSYAPWMHECLCVPSVLPWVRLFWSASWSVLVCIPCMHISKLCTTLSTHHSRFVSSACASIVVLLWLLSRRRALDTWYSVTTRKLQYLFQTWNIIAYLFIQLNLIGRWWDLGDEENVMTVGTENVLPTHLVEIPRIGLSVDENDSTVAENSFYFTSSTHILASSDGITITGNPLLPPWWTTAQHKVSSQSWWCGWCYVRSVSQNQGLMILKKKLHT